MDARKSAPSTARNREPISKILQPLLPESGLVLEIASGAGEHITSLAASRGSALEFQPSDPDEGARQSTDAWVAAMGLGNVRKAIEINAADPCWPVERADLVFCINMIHISPWVATAGLFQGASRLLPGDGVLYTYGPYKRGGVHTSAGNEAFDLDLRQRNPLWGIRDLSELTTLAASAEFGAPEIIEMPANNLSLIFRRNR